MPILRSKRARPALFSMAAAVALVALAIALPWLRNEEVRVHWPPLHGDWMPRFTHMSIVAIVVGLLLWWGFPILIRRMSLPGVIVTTYAATWSWIMALAFVDGSHGLSRVFDRAGEYVYDAVRVRSIPHMLGTFIDHIPRDSVDHWHTHVAGHPPGALLFFVILDRLGLKSHLWIGIVVVTLGTTAVIAALITFAKLGSLELARAAAPWLVLAPTAIWMGVTGDALYTAAGAWGLCLLAIAGKSGRRAPAVAGGMALGLCVYLSYGLPLLAVPALAVLWLCRTWRPLPWAIGGALGVAAAFTVAGFSWWEAYPVLVDRYYVGIASERPYSYWVWGNFAAWTLSVGVAVWAAFPSLPAAIKRRNPVAVLAAACLVAIVIADLSGMSKAEVARIWLPFSLWIVAIPALLPKSWWRPLLFSQVALALLVQHLVLTFQ